MTTTTTQDTHLSYKFVSLAEAQIMGLVQELTETGLRTLRAEYASGLTRGSARTFARAAMLDLLAERKIVIRHGLGEATALVDLLLDAVCVCDSSRLGQ